VAQAATNLEGADAVARRRLIDLLDIRVRVVGWDPCPTCSGMGLLPKLGPEASRRRLVNQRGLEDLRYKPVICPTCRRSRFIPKVTIMGTLPLDLTEASESQLTGLRFQADRAL
jgi:hypothetical protein